VIVRFVDVGGIVDHHKSKKKNLMFSVQKPILLQYCYSIK